MTFITQYECMCGFDICNLFIFIKHFLIIESFYARSSSSSIISKDVRRKIQAFIFIYWKCYNKSHLFFLQRTTNIDWVRHYFCFFWVLLLFQFLLIFCLQAIKNECYHLQILIANMFFFCYVFEWGYTALNEFRRKNFFFYLSNFDFVIWRGVDC